MEPNIYSNSLILLYQSQNQSVAAQPVKAEVPTGMAGALGRDGVPVKVPGLDLDRCCPLPAPRPGRVEEGSPCR